MRATLVSVNFRLSASRLDFHVDVRLRDFDGRWLAVADISGEHEIGLGRSPRGALADALASLGTAATVAFLADPQLIGIIDEVV